MGPTCRYLISYSADQMYPFVRSRAGQAGFDDFRGLRSDKDLAALRRALSDAERRVAELDAIL